MHASMHAGAVALFLGISYGCAEFVAHVSIDYAKCEGWFGEGQRAFVIDQALHVVCKIAWLLLAWNL
jgi:hypothetical protein